jgi:hypothetical protein
MEAIYQREWIRNGVTFGAALAMAISFGVNKSVFWAIVHGLMSWVYVVYYIIFY